ncbi:four-helix bundle copper-binding protein [Noviherbaspirillum galbum]|uniref:four-helix bundle copper-binding protein n=1 Tax=Noviherbaspirillum galbum TaxID=2709383 RepID=UPI00196A09DF|nr:four-helix bundle copper-binding protein [Noviherbaspirillum galbum]
MQMSSLSPDMQRCIDECLHCYRTCTEMAMNHCLESGGRHVEPEHFRLMMNCAAICRTSAEFMMSASPLHAATCAACAAVCDACADSCEQVGNMDECVQACRACAEMCHQMSQGGTSLGRMPDAGVQAGGLPIS